MKEKLGGGPPKNLEGGRRDYIGRGRQSETGTAGPWALFVIMPKEWPLSQSRSGLAHFSLTKVGVAPGPEYNVMKSIRFFSRGLRL